MRVLVTGSNGFIGRHLLSVLVSHGHEVIAFDLEKKEDDLSTNPRCFDVNGDVRNLSDLNQAMGQVDGVIHLAAISRSGRAELSPHETFYTNIQGMNNVLESIQLQSKKPWLLLGSSRVVDNINDESAYGISKITSERLMTYYCKRYGIDGLSLRLSDVYGAVDEKDGRLVYKLLKQAFNGDRLIIDYANLPFDFIYIEDVVKGIFKAAEFITKFKKENNSVKGSFQTVSISTGLHIDALGLAKKIVEVVGANSRIDVLDEETKFPCLKNDAERTNQKIDFKYSVSLDEGLNKMKSRLEAKPNNQIQA